MAIPMFGFTLICFLLLAVVLAIAIFFAFKSGEKGQTKLGGCAGCAIAAALLLIGGVGAIGLTIVGVMSFASEAVKHGPVRSFGFEWDDERNDARPSTTVPPGTEPEAPRSADALAPVTKSSEWGSTELRPTERKSPEQISPERMSTVQKPLRLTLEVRGKDGAAKVLEWLRKNTDAPISIAVHESVDDKNRPITTIELSLPLDDDDRAELEQARRDLERDLPDLKLPKGVKVEFRGTND